jgi:hypothetical protein
VVATLNRHADDINNHEGRIKALESKKDTLPTEVARERLPPRVEANQYLTAPRAYDS